MLIALQTGLPEVGCRGYCGPLAPGQGADGTQPRGLPGPIRQGDAFAGDQLHRGGQSIPAGHLSTRDQCEVQPSIFVTCSASKSSAWSAEITCRSSNGGCTRLPPPAYHRTSRRPGDCAQMVGRLGALLREVQASLRRGAPNSSTEGGFGHRLRLNQDRGYFYRALAHHGPQAWRTARQGIESQSKVSPVEHAPKERG